MGRDIRAHFAPAPGMTYLDWASQGMPPAPTVAAMRTALEAWEVGTADSVAPGAARLDVPLAWLPWVGAVASLELLLEWQAVGALEEARVLAGRLAERLGPAGPAGRHTGRGSAQPRTVPSEAVSRATARSSRS